MPRCHDRNQEGGGVFVHSEQNYTIEYRPPKTHLRAAPEPAHSVVREYAPARLYGCRAPRTLCSCLDCIERLRCVCRHDSRNASVHEVRRDVLLDAPRAFEVFERTGVACAMNAGLYTNCIEKGRPRICLTGRDGP